MFTVAAGNPPKTDTKLSNVSVLFGAELPKSATAEGPGIATIAGSWNLVPGPDWPPVSRLSFAPLPGTVKAATELKVESFTEIDCELPPNPVESSAGPLNVDASTLICPCPSPKFTFANPPTVLSVTLT